MEREYASGEVSNNAVFFTGVEVERTPAFGKKTLFITGIQPIEEIEKHCLSITHLFFGANHSFDAASAVEYGKWEAMISHFLEKGYLCSLDIPVTIAHVVVHSYLNSHNNFIPQLRVVIPHVTKWNYNGMVKIDDVDFNATNPGVWCHSIHNLLDRNAFTSWNDYANDVLIKDSND